MNELKVGSPNEFDIGRLLAGDGPPFALVHRPEATGPDRMEVLVGDVVALDCLADLPLPPLTDAGGSGATPRHDVVAIIPFRQIAERGFACRDDAAPLLAMRVTSQATVPVAEVVNRIPEVPIELRDGHFDVDDDSYAALVRKVIADEIGWGAGANFVIKRSFVADITDYGPRTAFALFRHLLEREVGAYWTFLVRTADRTFVGATPERHASLSDGTVVMNPISGTYRYPPTGPTVPEVLRFLADQKEADELYMVVDEELKMMTRVCDLGVRVVGPYLKEMAKLAHTEYLLEGRSVVDVTEILRHTMFAPTVTGSPLENACRVISRYEPSGRGYYSGVLALIGTDGQGRRTLDSSILIRTADIDRAGRMRIGVGATLVRHSDPASEVAETRAKAAALLAAFGAKGTSTAPATAASGRRAVPPRLGEHPQVRRALRRRNATLGRFWLRPQHASSSLAGRRVLIVDAEDTFTAMLEHQTRALGPTVTVRRFDEPIDWDGVDLVIVGPGPGDPRARDCPKIAALREITQRLLRQRQPFVSVCLGHQVLSRTLGFDLIRIQTPNQGVQREIELFGQRRKVGFYNTFVAWSDVDEVTCPGVPGVVRVSRDVDSGEVYALRGDHFRSIQFHAESVLTEEGAAILGDLLGGLVAPIALAS